MFGYELLETRTISGKGVLKVPEDSHKNRTYAVFASLVRPPYNSFKNFNYNPPKSKFAFMSFLRSGYVISSTTMDYEKQAYDGINDISGQTLNALKCVNNAILQSIYNLSVALAATPGSTGLTPIVFTNIIKDYNNLNLSWDECRVSCYADTAINLRLYALKYDTCNADFDADISPLVPDPIPQTPPGQPIQGIDNPYDGVNDDGNTVAYPGDLPPIPPPPTTIGDECQAGTLKVNLVINNAGTIQDSVARIAVYGPVSIEFRTRPGQPNVLETIHRGYPNSGGCEPPAYREVISFGATTTIVSWNTPIFPNG